MTLSTSILLFLLKAAQIGRFEPLPQLSQMGLLLLIHELLILTLVLSFLHEVGEEEIRVGGT